MKQQTKLKTTRASLRYTVEIYRGDEEGGKKNVDFESRVIALAFAERQHARGYAVQLHDHFKHKIIYDEM